MKGDEQDAQRRWYRANRSRSGNWPGTRCQTETMGRQGNGGRNRLRR